MKRLITILLGVILLGACENSSSYEEWVGEYTLQISIDVVSPDGTISGFDLTVEEPMSIYMHKGHLYVQSCFGQPYMGEGDIIPPAKNSTQKIGAAVDSILPIINDTPRVIVSTFVKSIYKGVVYYPLPIKVVSCNSQQLKLQQGKEFSVPVTDKEGRPAGTATYCNHYEPICLGQGCLNWEVELLCKYPASLDSPSASGTSSIKTLYHCVAYKNY